MQKLLTAMTYSFDYSIMPKSMTQCDNGDYIIVGNSNVKGTDASALAIRVASDGSLIWYKNYTSPFILLFNSITQIAENRFIAVGSYFYSSNSGDEYVWIVNLDGEGNVLSKQAYGIVGIQSDGLDVCSTSDGGYAVSGLVVDNNKASTVVLKFDSSNNLEWKQILEVGAAFSIAATCDDGFVLCGAANKADSLMSNVFVTRLDPYGKLLWQNVYTDYDIYVLLNSDIIQTKNGHFALVAKSVIMEIDQCGNLLWALQDKDYNLYSIAQTADGNYGIAGSIISKNSYDHSYIAYLNGTDHSIIWNNTDILYPSGINKLIIDEYGNFNVSGYAPVNNDMTQAFFAAFDVN